MFPNQDPINRHVYWTDPVLQFVPGIPTTPHRIIGVTADIDDLHIVPEPSVTIYSTFEEGRVFARRLFIHSSADPYALVTPGARPNRGMSAPHRDERTA